MNDICFFLTRQKFPNIFTSLQNSTSNIFSFFSTLFIGYSNSWLDQIRLKSYFYVCEKFRFSYPRNVNQFRRLEFVVFLPCGTVREKNSAETNETSKKSSSSVKNYLFFSFFFFSLLHFFPQLLQHRTHFRLKNQL